MRPHLVVKLKRGWRYDRKKRAFVSTGQKKLAPHSELPDGTRIQLMVPALADKDPQSLTTEEADLAQYVYVVLPKQARVSAHLPKVQRWECVADARIPPDISLPG